MQCCTCHPGHWITRSCSYRETQVIIYPECSCHTGFLQEAYKENISEQFLPGNKEEAIYLPTFFPPSIAHFCVSLSRKHTALCLQSASPAPHWSCPGVVFHPNLGAEVWLEHPPQEKKRRSQSRGSEKHVEFMSNIVLTNSMQESDKIWHHCREQLRTGWEWKYGDQQGSYCNGPEESRWCLKLRWWIWKWREVSNDETF